VVRLIGLVPGCVEEGQTSLELKCDAKEVMSEVMSIDEHTVE
jgi:hypothetical protein